MSVPDAAADVAPRPGRFGRVTWLLRVLEVRFRFIILLAALLLVFGGWSSLQSRFDWFLRKLRNVAETEAVVSSDTEYFCPMDPGVLSDWPEKCPICQMSLVRRKKGDAAILPSGVTARMQLTPERVQLAGVLTMPVEYRPLNRELAVGGVISPIGADSPGTWDFEAAIARADIPLAVHADAGQLSLHVDGLSDASASVSKLKLVQTDGHAAPRVRVELSDPDGTLSSGQYVAVTLRVPAAAFEPFRALSISPPAMRDGEMRSVYYCPNHGDTLHEAPGKCPLDQQALLERTLHDNERLGWWCPMHPRVTADEPGHLCAECNGMRLVPRVKSYAPAGTVLAIPESAVVDFGRERVVYVERMPGMYDRVRVELGPSSDGQFPVLSGLASGDRVVAAGAFLLDAETRLNPALANSYFGAGPNVGVTAKVPTATDNKSDEAQSQRIAAALKQLSPQDRAAAERQGTCPVTGLPLGSMGAPIKVTSSGRQVFVCCAGCIDQLESSEQPAKSE
ncbi:MAG: heavy metal-binding domain-containing protein [Planctomycetia bacterium]|nr:heavy metal-binding domain-containing protein [Planctomycetia bacterium]